MSLFDKALSRREFIRNTTSAAIAATGLAGRPALASDFPDRPITFICPWSPGGTADQSMRALCMAASKAIGQSIVLENKAGVSGMLGLHALSIAKPDGYTVGQIPISVTRFFQLGIVQVDPRKDLTYLARTSGQTFGVAVLPNSRWGSFDELIAYAKAHPGEVTYAHPGLGGYPHAGMEQVLSLAGAKMLGIPFKGGADALQAVFGGHVDVLVDSSSWASLVLDKKLKLLVTWGAQRLDRFPDTPTLKELGYDVVIDAPNGVGAPPNLDPRVAAKLRDAFRVAAASDEFKRACAQIDAPVMYMDGPEYRDYVMQTYKEETQLIEQLHLRDIVKI